MIVIALIGAIALVVIAAINPIEQANRARDTRLRADSAQMVAAIERYFVTLEEFPWETTGAVADSRDAFDWANGASVDVGICGDAGCTTNGSLISNEELKSEFLNRDFIKNRTTVSKSLRIGKGQGSAESIFVCYIPASKTTRERSIADDQVYSLSAAGAKGAPTCTAADDDWAASGCYICVPE